MVPSIHGNVERPHRWMGMWDRTTGLFLEYWQSSHPRNGLGCADLFAEFDDSQECVPPTSDHRNSVKYPGVLFGHFFQCCRISRGEGFPVPGESRASTNFYCTTSAICTIQRHLQWTCSRFDTATVPPISLFPHIALGDLQWTTACSVVSSGFTFGKVHPS